MLVALILIILNGLRNEQTGSLVQLSDLRRGVRSGSSVVSEVGAVVWWVGWLQGNIIVQGLVNMFIYYTFLMTTDLPRY